MLYFYYNFAVEAHAINSIITEYLFSYKGHLITFMVN